MIRSDLSPDFPSGVRVRYAPSPTGYLHIGGLRTALFNWLFARRHKGKFLVRVEDTDLERSRPEYTDAILTSLAWCGLDADEPIVYQSARFAEYQEIAQKLLAAGSAYRCYCTQEEVRARVRASSSGSGEEYYFYDGRCRDIVTVLDKPFVIRVRVPRDRDMLVVQDLIHGELRFPLAPIDDFVIVRSNGAPMYNFTVVVDDVLMGITHVIRGDDHIINTPRQILLYEAAGFPLPHFGHVPLIVGRDGKKLSKRDAATAVGDYRRQGILPEALCNYLVRLGWAYEDREVIARDELITLFDLAQVGVKSAMFDPEKLLWMNGVYLKNSSPEELVGAIESDPNSQFRAQLAGWADVQILQAVRLYQSRVKTLVELADVLVSLAQDPQIPVPVLSETQHAAFVTLQDELMRLDEWEIPLLKEAITHSAKAHALGFAALAGPMRILLTGVSSAPSVADLLALLGKTVSLRRLSRLPLGL